MYGLREDQFILGFLFKCTFHQGVNFGNYLLLNIDQRYYSLFYYTINCQSYMGHLPFHIVCLCLA